ncbi:tetratricopeptide repeat protein [Pseudalkalibacillus decolorationis]|uniref:tetratricopeptide repeat protein n=1 Tax=Pseudalkalibacillus decolorationis TaxID=163879 RepID=UPI0021494910|nr:tetratricopeptide repeat protein [Pseudalkalibacillus decolorationis]
MKDLGVSPLLVKFLTGEAVNKPSVAAVSGNYTQLIVEKMDDFPMLMSKNEMSMKCGDCSEIGTYDVGTVLVNKEKLQGEGETEDALQFTGYFRCESCNSAGNWEITRDHLIRVTTALQMTDGPVKDDRFAVGEYQLFDGTTHQFATDSEEYLLKKMLSDDDADDRALIWNKLGNVYWKGNRPDLAVAAFERSIELGAGHSESQFSLGQILNRADELEKAAFHYRKMLVGARHYKNLDATEFRELLANGLLDLFSITAQSEGTIQALPTREDLKLSDSEASEFGDYFNLDFEPNLDDPMSFYPIAEIFMGKRQKELRADERTYTPVISIARQRKRKLEQKRRKKKKRR